MKNIAQYRKSLMATALVVSLFTVGFAGNALAMPMMLRGIETRVNFNTDTLDALIGLGYELGTIGTAEVKLDGPQPWIDFPITGGMFDFGTGIGMIEHDGSGFSLTKNGITTSFENFLIDTGSALLSGKVSVGATVLEDFNIFDIGADLELTLTDMASMAIFDIYGDDLGNAEIGIGAPNLDPVPEPSTMLLLAAGLFGVGYNGYRKRKQAAA